MAALSVLPFSFGGHWVEVWFLNWLRPQISAARGVQVAARVTVWFAGGAGLALIARWPWWIGGLGFIGIELVAHLAMQLRGVSNFYNGRG